MTAKEKNNESSRRRNLKPERIAYLKAYHAAHPKDRSAYKANYDATHRDQAKAYKNLNRKNRKAKSAARYVANRARILARVKAHSAANKIRLAAYQRDYYSKNTEKVEVRSKVYREANPERKWHCENRRRVRKYGNGGSHTLDEVQEKFANLGSACFYCGQPGKLTIDHDIPISRGGTDSIDNILPSCQPCNSRKNTKTAQEYLFHLHLHR